MLPSALIKPQDHNTMTIFEAIETILNMAKAEYDNSVEECTHNVEALNDMQEALTVVEGWIIDIKLGGTTAR